MIAPTQGLVLVLLALIVLGFGGFFWRASLLYRLLRLGRNEGARRFYERHGLELAELTDGGANEEREPDARYDYRP